MKRPLWMLVGLVLALLLTSCNSKEVAEARPSVDAWLALVDGGQYADSWKTASASFQSHVDVVTWEKQAAGVRQPLGSVKSRTLKSALPMAKVPGAPDGAYVVFQFDTSFEHKQSATETVTPMKEADGTWKVSGYYVK